MCLIAKAKEFLHQRPDQHKSYPGWQEPGLWRPKWVLERDFPATETSKAYKDRLYIKLKPDRTIDIINSRKRPLLQIFKGRNARREAEKKALFETGTENSLSNSPNAALQESIYEAEGTWSFADESPMPTGRVILETRERQKDGTVLRIRHECRCEWGKNDDYAAKFRRGKLFKYKGVQRGSDIPLGKYAAGSFILRANAQRPLVSKDFQAFQ
jgi:hypothetical protein